MSIRATDTGVTNLARHLQTGLYVLSLAAAQVYAAGDHVVEEQKFTDYKTAHTVIKCPYLPEGISDLPSCGGRPVNSPVTAGRVHGLGE